MARLRFALLLLALFALVVSSGGGLFDITCGDDPQYPVLLENNEATEVTTTSARLNASCTRCSLSGGSVQVRFLYEPGGGVVSIDPDTAMATEYQSVTRMQDFSAVIGGLIPGTEYCYTAIWDGEGSSDWLAEEVEYPACFTTLSLVETVGAVYPSTTMALLRGNLPDLGGASSVEVYFAWGENPGVYTHESPRQTVTAPGEFTQMITGPFNIGSTYYFVARAGAAQGEEKSFTVQ